MKPTKEQLVELRYTLEVSVVQPHWDTTRKEYIKYLGMAARRIDEYAEIELNNLVTGAELVLEQAQH